jgi:phage terminase large subunit
MDVRAEFPEKLLPGLFDPHRYKVIRGGRGSAKSWSVARALLIKGTQAPLRILCARETQRSIRDSVHKLLVDQMVRLRLSGEYLAQQVAITGGAGSYFAFAGLSDLTAESIKSFEGFDIVWIEEAQVVSDRSWTILIPTIRKENSEIWVTFNPELDTDPTWKRFIATPPPDTWSVELNWRDNPWFTSVLEQERAHAERTLPTEDYLNIWEGKTRSTVSGAIYAAEVAAMHAERRVCELPYDPYHRVHIVVDIGWNDRMSIGFWQRHLSQLRLIDYLEDDHRTWDWYSARFREKPYAYGRVFLPHDGDKGNPQTGKTDRQILEGLGWNVSVLERRDVEQGIRDTRMAMKTMAMDRSRTEGLLEHLRRYRRMIPKTTNEPAQPFHDIHSHGADMVRYAAQAAPFMDDDEGMKLPDLDYGRASHI